MNKLVQKFAEQSTTYTWMPGQGTMVEFDKEKFAELIVRECSRIVQYRQDRFDPIEYILILREFGLK